MKKFQPEFTEQRQNLFEDRYALKSESGELLEHKPEQMWRRLATTIGRNKKEVDKYLEALENFLFVPAGRQLLGIGSGTTSTFFNCYFVPFRKDPEHGRDSRESILDTLKTCVEIQARGGGIGLNWSVLRPKGALVKKVHGKSSGTVSWMSAFDSVFQQVEQGGSRRGASMFLLESWSPDILDLIEAKSDDENKLTMANISVGVSEDFMQAVKNDKVWQLKFPDTSFPSYDEEWDGQISKWEEKGYPIDVYEEIPARKIWHKIAKNAHKSAEPGIVWLERADQQSNTKYFETIRGTNPCSELPLPPYGVCNLGAVNLVEILNKNGKVDWDKLKFAVRQGVKFLDTVIDHNTFVLDQTKEQQEKIRRVGLGTMGLADLFLIKDIKYGSDKSLEVIEEIYSFIRDEAYRMSTELAKKRDPAPAYYEDQFLEMPFIQTLSDNVKGKIKGNGIRNLVLLTQAPTGSTSQLAGVSSGIEPNYAWEYTRKDGMGERTVTHWLKDKIEDNGQFVSAKELDPTDHVKVQGKIQKFIDNSISKTINAPKNHTIEDVKETFMEAYDRGCKGITYYREGSRTGVMEEEKEECPECGTELKIEEGCKTCPNCGWGACEEELALT